ncbi:MAG: sugar phosphate isomerase/epimerase [Acidobacteria bacterium]|nr:sugar phosphate isomerase/epimerase [Acidobacteriota bacterium]
MKVGFQTITWGIRFENRRALVRALDLIHHFGFQGVEFAQRPEALGVRGIQDLIGLLRERDLRLLTFTAGTLQERVHFCAGLARKDLPEYMYVEDWDWDFAKAALRQGHTLALHQRAFGRERRFEQAQKILKLQPKLKFLPDTAHLMIAGDDPVAVIRKAFHRVIAVHLKDWTPDFGRSSNRWAKGLTELGAGLVKFDEVVQLLEEKRYTGWVVAELDSAWKDPEAVLESSARWLFEKRLIPEPKPIRRTRAYRAIIPVIAARRDKAKDIEFMSSVLSAAGAADSFYDNLANALRRLIPSELVKVWTCSPTQNYMGLRAIAPADIPAARLEPTVMRLDESLSGVAMARQAAMTQFDLTKDRPAKAYGYPRRQFFQRQMVESGRISRLVVVPVFNLGNQNYVRLILNVFLGDHAYPKPRTFVDTSGFYALWYSSEGRLRARGILSRTSPGSPPEPS